MFCFHELIGSSILKPSFQSLFENLPCMSFSYFYNARQTQKNGSHILTLNANTPTGGFVVHRRDRTVEAIFYFCIGLIFPAGRTAGKLNQQNTIIPCIKL